METDTPFDETRIATNCGDVSLEPTDAVVAGTYGTWTITYTVGKLAMDDGSTLRIASNMSSDWGPPQFDDPTADNYCSVATTGEATVEATFDHRGHTRPWRDTILVEVFDGSLSQGDTITITLGDRSHGSMGFQTQSYPEHEFTLFGLVEPFETGEYVRLPTELHFDIVPGAPQSLMAVIESEVVSGEQADLAVRLHDEWGNVATEYDKTIELHVPEGIEAPDTIQLQEGTGHATVLIEIPGIYRLSINSTDGELEAETNPVRCTTDSVNRATYWGDIHGQSEETVGTGTIQEYFSFARDRAFLDFASHAGNDFQITNEFWETIRDTVETYNQPGEFVTFLCYEWSANTPSGGDHNVYFRNDETEIHRSSNWQVEDGPKRSMGTYPVEKLYDLYEGRDDVIIIPHQGGRPATLDHLVPEMTPFVEILSVWGIFEWFGQDALERGYPVGFVAGSDDHTGRLGASYPATTDWSFPIKGGLMAARATAKDRDSLWEAFTNRRCYGTTGARILLDVNIEGRGMGSKISVAESPSINVNVAGTAPLQKIDLFDGSDCIGTKRFDTGDERIEFAWTGARSKNRQKVQNWTGGLSIDQGKFESIEPFGFDHPDDGIDLQTSTSIKWTGSTAGNTQGIRVAVDGLPETTLSFNTELISTDVTLGRVQDQRFPIDSGVESNLSIRRIGDSIQRDVETAFSPDIGEGSHQIYARVTQMDREMAWSSPIFVEVE